MKKLLLAAAIASLSTGVTRIMRAFFMTVFLKSILGRQLIKLL
jgi:hypothetical protein